MLLDELKEYGKVLSALIMNNKQCSLDHPDDPYYLGKVDAYEVAYEDYIRRLRKVDSFISRVKG
jgi:hypothetical protein